MRNKVLKAITFIAVMTLILGVSMIDSDSYIPPVMCLMSLAWLCPFVYANRERCCK